MTCIRNICKWMSTFTLLCLLLVTPCMAEGEARVYEEGMRLILVPRNATATDSVTAITAAHITCDHTMLRVGEETVWTLHLEGASADAYTFDYSLLYQAPTDHFDTYYYSAGVSGVTELSFVQTPAAQGKYIVLVSIRDQYEGVLEVQSSFYVTVDDSSTEGDALAQKVAEVVSLCKESGAESEYEIALFMHDYLINNADYDQTYTHYFPDGVLLYGTGVCQSYATAYQILMEEMGVECLLVVGTSKGEDHSWNMVKIDGMWYQVDCTWDDPIGGSEQHAYFLITDEVMAEDHEWDEAAYPSCESSRYVGDSSGNIQIDVHFATEDEFRLGMDAAAKSKKTSVYVQYTGPELSIEYEDKLISTYLTNWWKVSGEPTYGVIGCLAWGYLSWDYRIAELAYYENVEASNPYIYKNDDFTYAIENDQVLIGQYIGTDTTVIVPGEIMGYPVREISCHAFTQNTSVEEVIISEGVKTIQNGDVDTVWYNTFVSSFYQCTSLRRVVFPSSLEYVGNYAFSGCSSLQEVKLNEGLKTIGIYAFQDCISLKELTLPQTITEFNTECIVNTGIQSLHLSAGVQELFYQDAVYDITVDDNSSYFTMLDDVMYTKDLSKCAYYPQKKTDEEYFVPEGCTYFYARSNPYLKILHLSSTVEQLFQSPAIEYYDVDEDNPTYHSVDGVVFSKDMKALEYYPPQKQDKVYYVPDGVERLGYGYAFYQNQHIQRVYIPASVTYIGVGFRESTVEEVVFAPGSQLQQMNDSFRDCHHLQRIELPEGLEALYDTFDGCSQLEEITLPSTLKWIENYTFSGTALKSIKLPADMAVLGYGAFWCDSLEYAYIPGEIELADLSAFRSGVTIVGPKGSFAEKYAADAALQFLAIDIGEEDGEDAPEHQWINGALFAMPTGNSAGVMAYICQDCGEVKAVEITLGIAGDANEDSAVDMLDIIALMEWYCGGIIELNLANGEVNGDGSIDMLDMIDLMEWYCGAEVALCGYAEEVIE